MAGQGRYKDLTAVNPRSHATNRVKLKVLFPRKQKAKRSFLYQAAELWNSLPTFLHCRMTSDEFKKEATRYLEGEINIPMQNTNLETKLLTSPKTKVPAIYD